MNSQIIKKALFQLDDIQGHMNDLNTNKSEIDKINLALEEILEYAKVTLKDVNE